jgi:hypothetical protein
MGIWSHVTVAMGSNLNQVSSQPIKYSAARNETTLTVRIVTYLVVCDCRRGTCWILDLLTACTHHLELQVITALLLISTLCKTQQHQLRVSQPAVFTSRSLAIASNIWNSRAHVITVQRLSCKCTLFFIAGFSTRNWTGSSSAYFAELLSTANPQVNPLTHQPTTSRHFTQLNCTRPAWGPRNIASWRTQQKTPPPTIPSNSSETVDVFTGR